MRISANGSYSGGFLGILAGLATKVFPSLLAGLSTGLIYVGVAKAITGNDLYHTYKLTPTKGGNCLFVEGGKQTTFSF